MLSLLALAATAGPSQRIVASFPFLNGERLAIHRRSDGRVVTLGAAGGGLFAVDIGDDLRSPQLAPGTFRSQLKFTRPTTMSAAAPCCDASNRGRGITARSHFSPPRSSSSPGPRPAPHLDARETAIFVAAGHAGVILRRVVVQDDRTRRPATCAPSRFAAAPSLPARRTSSARRRSTRTTRRRRAAVVGARRRRGASRAMARRWWSAAGALVCRPTVSTARSRRGATARR